MTNLEQYRGIFLQDAAESFRKIRAAIVVLHKDPTNADAIFEILRLFHSMKSSSAMMGFEKISKSCAIKEKLFREVQSGQVLLSKAVLDDIAAVAAAIEGELK